MLTPSEALADAKPGKRMLIERPDEAESKVAT
jgi:hypothetical protein